MYMMKIATENTENKPRGRWRMGKVERDKSLRKWSLCPTQRYDAGAPKRRGPGQARNTPVKPNHEGN